MDKSPSAVAIVTAAAGELGTATARILTARGCRVVLADVQDDKGRVLAASLGGAGRYVHVQPGNEFDMHGLVFGTCQREGRLDALFNYAALEGPPLGIADLTPETWDAVLAVLLRGAYLGLHYAAACMRWQGGGTIVSGAAPARPDVWPSHGAAAANAAIVRLTRSVALELAGTGVRVNCICPQPDDDPVAIATAAVEGALRPPGRS